MADYPQYIFQPGVQPDTGEGLAKGISQLGAGIGGAIEKHEIDLQRDASNEMIFGQALESGEINPQVLGYKLGEKPSDAEMYAKFKGATRNQQNGWITGLIGNYAGKLAEQQAEIKLRVKQAQMYGAQAGLYSGMGGAGGAGGGGGPGGAVQTRPVLDPQGRVIPDQAVATVPSGSRGGTRSFVVQLPKTKTATVIHVDDAGTPFTLDKDQTPHLLSTDEMTALELYQQRQKMRMQSPKEGQQGQAAAAATPAPGGKIKVISPDDGKVYYMRPEDFAAAEQQGLGYRQVP